MKNMTEDGDLQLYTVDQQESSIFRVLSCLNLHCWLYSSSRSAFLKQKQKIFQNISSF
jgi:antibiotic biosynthesis monooxygenase (ABM) superfamily enzyme